MPRVPLPPRADVAVAGCVAAVSVADTWLNAAVQPRGVATAGFVVASGALAWRRAAPLAATAVVVAACTATVVLGVPLGEPIGVLLAPVVAVYSLTSYARLARAVTGSALVVASVGVQTTVQRTGLDNFAFALVFVGAMWAMGLTVRRRTAQAVALELAAARLRDEQEQRDRQAAEAERARIARELHDVVAHSLSIMTVQAGAAAEVLDRDPAAARTAIRAVEHSGRESMAEMARLLGVLRQGGDELGLAPQPRIDDVERLVAESRASGLPVELEVHGTRRPLPAGVELAVYRIVQEALTNTRKHAGAVPATVVLRYEDGAVAVEVTDGGAPGGGAPGPGGGHGLAGMRERVAMYGGELHAGRAGSGFAVRVRIPVRVDA